jgi:predicted acylesterase/phospholipase RssA
MLKIRKYFLRRYGMSGTPNPISVMELHTPTLIIDNGKRLGQSYYALRQVVQEPTQIGPKPEHRRWDDKPGAAQVIEQKLSDITIRHAFEDVMKHVPPNHRHTMDFDLSARALKAYKTIERDAILAWDNGDVITAVHAASLRNKLLQVASGAV